MYNCKQAEDILNQEAVKILKLIKNDYYAFMSQEKKNTIDTLISEGKVVIVNEGLYIDDPGIFALVSKKFKERRINFYPEARSFESFENFIQYAKGILPHECFHYFIRPNDHMDKQRVSREMVRFYKEGLVEREARRFYEAHKSEISFSKAGYGYNIDFVNMVQPKLSADTYEVIFGESDYINGINDYTKEYNELLANQEERKNLVKKELKGLPKIRGNLIKIIEEEGIKAPIEEKLEIFKQSIPKEKNEEMTR